MGERFTGASRGKECKLTYILRPPEQYHRFGINSLALSILDGGKFLFTAGRDSVIRKWGVTATSCDASSSRSLSGHTDWVNDVLTFHDTGGTTERLVSCSSDTTLRVWDPSARRCMVTVKEHSDYVKALAMVNSNTIASGALDARVCLWDAESWKLKGECGGQDGVKGSVYCLAGCGTGNANIVVAGSTNRIVSIWDTRSGDKVAKLKGHNDSVRCLSVRRDGLLVLSGGSDSLIRLWDLRQQREVKWYDPHADSVWALAASRDFSWFLSGGRDGSIFHTEVESGVSSIVVSAIGSAKDNMVLSTVATPNESGVWVSNAGSSVKLWQITTDTKLKNGDGEDVDIAKLPPPPPLAVIPGLPGTMSYRIMNNKRHVLTKDSDGVVVLWDITQARALKDFQVADLDEIANQIEEEVFVPSWFSIEIRLGSVGVKLDRSCFKAEIYAVDAGLEADNEEIKVNIGEHVLRGLFRWWKASYDKAKGQAQEAEEKPAPGYSDYAFPEYTQIIISEEGSPVPILQKEASQLVASDEDLIPLWVLETVRDGLSMTKEGPKMSFLLKPEQASNLRNLEFSKLSAPRVLRIRKVVTYLVNNLSENNGDKESSGKPLEDSDVEIVCNGRVLPPKMSLGAVKQFVWKDISDLELTYRVKSAAKTVGPS